MPQRDHADDHRRRKTLKASHPQLLDMPPQYSGRLNNSVTESVGFRLPDVSVFVIGSRCRNPDLELGLVLSQHCPLDAYEDALGAIGRWGVGAGS